MDLLTLTRGRYVRVGLAADSKESAIEQLLDVLVAGELPRAARGDVLHAILERERRLSTGLECGIAIPHGTTPHVEQEVAALGIYPAGVPFETVDENTARIVILLVTPQLGRHRHVNNLAALARQLLSPGLRAALLRASSVEEALAVVRASSPVTHG